MKKIFISEILLLILHFVNYYAHPIFDNNKNHITMVKQNAPETKPSIEALNDSLTGIEQKVENNKKIIVWASLIVAALVIIVLGYIYGIRKPGVAAANDAIGQADITMMMGNDSLALQQYQQVADEHGYDAGNRANLNAAILLYRQGKYQEAIDYLNNYDAKEEVIGAAAMGLEGDCYVNLKQYPEAIKCFREAAAMSDHNPHLTPYFMMKEATVQHEVKDYKAEADLYQAIINDYPQYAADQQIDFRKYLERAKALQGE